MTLTCAARRVAADGLWSPSVVQDHGRHITGARASSPPAVGHADMCKHAQHQTHMGHADTVAAGSRTNQTSPP